MFPGRRQAPLVRMQRTGGLAFQITGCMVPWSWFPPVDVVHPGIASHPGSQDQVGSQSCLCWQSACAAARDPRPGSGN